MSVQSSRARATAGNPDGPRSFATFAMDGDRCARARERPRWRVIALALGIGLTTVMFTIIYGLLLRGLPFEQSGPHRDDHGSESIAWRA